MCLVLLLGSEEWLQQGRAPLSAEVWFLVRLVGRAGFASTGPRSFERGGRQCDDYEENRGRASTGPRSFERGGSAFASRVLRLIPGFNRAALL